MTAVSQVDEVGARDGTALRIRHWPVTSGEPWASMLLVHGLAEHSGRYEHVGAQLAGAGIDAYAFDLRGFGASGGPRASVERWSQLHDDLEERLVAVRSIAPKRPLVLYGHSLGGLIALGYVLDGRALPDLLVVSAPAIGATVPVWQRALVSSLRHMAPGMQLSNRLKGEVLARDPAVSARYFADPLNQHKTTVRFAHAAFAEQRRVAAALDRLSIQTLVVHGGADRLVPTDSSRLLDGRPGVTRRVYPDLRHESHNEPEGPQVVADIIGWVREKASRLQAAAAVPSR
ncbi:MAG TPA: alpha/beta hydrolase [Candidatus Dormibacteraeota bacterium]|nr:alpha/beta hydrolase [Candidatus Dormibacteraeota bacterium]